MNNFELFFLKLYLNTFPVYSFQYWSLLVYLCLYSPILVYPGLSWAISIYLRLFQSQAISGNLGTSWVIHGFRGLSLAILSYFWIFKSISGYIIYKVWIIRVQLEAGLSKLLWFENFCYFLKVTLTWVIEELVLLKIN